MDLRDYFELQTTVEDWQACSHPILCEMGPDALFGSSFTERYKCLHELLWGIMQRLHGTLETIKELESFPFLEIYNSNDMEFWRLTYMNSVDAAILLLHKLVNDSGTDVVSLRSFKNEIVKTDWLDLEMKKLFVTTLFERKFDPMANAIAKRVEIIRNHDVGHLLVDQITGGRKLENISLKLEDLQKLFKAAHRLFGAISFGSGYATLGGDLMPSTINGKRKQSCLRRVLDALLRASDFVNQPELRSPYWEMQRKYMSPQRLQVMNELRKRVGLPEA
jgi:hypothetical protein